MIPFTNLSDRHIEVVCNENKRIARSNAIVVNGTMISLIAFGGMSGSLRPGTGPVADFKCFPRNNVRSAQVVPAAKVRNANMKMYGNAAKRVTALNPVGADAIAHLHDPPPSRNNRDCDSVDSG